MTNIRAYDRKLAWYNHDRVSRFSGENVEGENGVQGSMKAAKSLNVLRRWLSAYDCCKPWCTECIYYYDGAECLDRSTRADVRLLRL